MPPGKQQYSLCFRSLFHAGRGYAFPSDAQGRVELSALSERARRNYQCARSVVGPELACGSVEREEDDFDDPFFPRAHGTPK
jgi:hypothetical protein